jgi:hypothetical protein
LNGTHLLVLLIDKGGSFHLRPAKAGATGTLLKRLGEILEIDMSREIPPPRRGRMAKIWLDDSASAQATSLADFWGDSAGEETLARREDPGHLSGHGHSPYVGRGAPGHRPFISPVTA